MNQEPDFGSLMPDTFVDLGNDSYGGSVDDYQSQMNDFDLRGPNVQYLPSAGGGVEEEEEEECCEDLLECNAALGAALEKIDCLTDIVLPEQLNGSGSWSHSVGTSITTPGQACGYTHTSKISIKFIEMSGNNPNMQFYRTNNGSPCQANGSINWHLTLTPDGSGSPLPIPWSGGKYATTVLDRVIGPGTYYVYAYGLNLVDNAGQQTLQYKGVFTISVVTEGNPPVKTGKMERSFEVTNTVVEGEDLPCDVTEPVPEV